MGNLLSAKDNIQTKIYNIRGIDVMLDSDIAELYGVETREVNQAVVRNPDKFPHDFMFELTAEEFASLKSQIVTSSWGGRRKLPKVFTEQGVYLSATADTITIFEDMILDVKAATEVENIWFLRSDK